MKVSLDWLESFASERPLRSAAQFGQWPVCWLGWWTRNRLA